MLNIPRPKSSPSTFPPNVEDLLFAENPYKFNKTEEYPSFTFPLSPAKTSSPYFTHDYTATSRTSPARHAPIPIAPDPVGLRQLHALKRMREDDEFAEYGQRKRKRAPSNTGPVELNEEETLLLKLKEEENLPWKDIAVRFQTDLGKSYQVPALQMRFKRLRERMRTWTETDVSNRFSFSSPLSAAAQGLISDSDLSARTSIRLLGEIPVRHYCSKGWSHRYDSVVGRMAHTVSDARFRRGRTVACQVLRA